jgi:hypothetical protein
MTASAGQILRRIPRRPLAVIFAVLLIVVQLGAFHSHHDAREERECALCMAAHTPLVQAPAAPAPLPEHVALKLEPAALERAPEASPAFSVAPRSPPSL